MGDGWRSNASRAVILFTRRDSIPYLIKNNSRIAYGISQNRNLIIHDSRYATCDKQAGEFSIKPLFIFIIAVFSLFTLAACGGSAPAQGWSSATLDNGSLYFGSTLPKVYALDAAT